MFTTGMLHQNTSQQLDGQRLPKAIGAKLCTGTRYVGQARKSSGGSIVQNKISSICVPGNSLRDPGFLLRASCWSQGTGGKKICLGLLPNHCHKNWRIAKHRLEKYHGCQPGTLMTHHRHQNWKKHVQTLTCLAQLAAFGRVCIKLGVGPARQSFFAHMKQVLSRPFVRGNVFEHFSTPQNRPCVWVAVATLS